MRDELELRAMEHHAEQVRHGTGDLYAYYRFYENHFLLHGLPDEHELMRRAILAIFMSDPYAYATTFAFDIGLLTEAELEQVAAAIQFEGDEDGSRLLRGRLWADAGRSKESPEAYLKRAVAETEAVPEERRGKDDWRALAECYRRLDYERFKQVAQKLLAAADPEWRAHDLINVIMDIAEHADWTEYESLRRQWDELPANAHFCECYFNSLHTADGLYALSRSDVDSAVAALRLSMDVKGCPHLNTGGPSLRLVKALIERGELREQCIAYLDFCDQFVSAERTSELREQLTQEG